MEETKQFETQTKALIDDLKSVCANYGLGNDGNEFKIITQVFLYKFLNDKYVYELKQLDPKLASEENFDEALENYPADDLEMLMMQISAKTARFAPKNLLPNLAKQQNKPKFAIIFDETLLEVAKANNDIFSVKTKGGEKIVLFDNISKYVTDNRDDFCKALVSKMTTFSFEHIFTQKFDFFATIFEYLIKDYNTNAGGKYAEYFTPHAVAKIMAACLVTDKNVNNVTCYDPSAGSGTLLMNIAHAIGEEKCTIYSQDISQKSSALLRLNLILNDLVHSIKNIIQGNTILNPYHKQDDGQLEQFDYIVSNPPFKLDFSDYSADLDSKVNKERFFAGIPNVPKSKKDAMAIYLLFIQHIMHSLTEKGKAAIVVPTGFITAQSGIDKKIRQKMVESKMLAGVVSMPSNIFATTGTNVSILFLDKTNTKDVVLIDASNLGTKVKEGKTQKTVLSAIEEQQIIDVFNAKKVVEDLSIVVSYDEIKAKNYSLSAGQYFEVKIEYTDISADEFTAKMKGFEDNLESLFSESKGLEKEIQHNLKGLKYE
ncbi:SAM-dependent DNA methyltransferase [Tenacibaculum finnmarkense genomovar finnmarkense]|uniref:HsdM family class I SAM-dependent methyltransferase n=1 Tax=Tenacibaculum finnmarkense TaxID=2781243 RepID=UPI001E3B79E5|nr:class I SAM-dependent DNA methyltransferase [Tenacibaculum finnmarkense]MCD8417849.1 type I restriction-modification system subunit M [Tenacibaculum finnmarkense genomovar finnmarkense]MCG8186238.1 SAM-dependent DNA methyltransferase [Tenacibaculum finnmarkense genomovar finnmarkense]MCG8203002.1 SAM-dependent DNA methyltransferase [Tenacibaculum finnmarkense genomovar finnmarkense]MCG8210315.1 SAM-dependent DNA methyltransferase [Tenacibaculum finnmarkense genomovar finnmarkense]MCG8212902